LALGGGGGVAGRRPGGGGDGVCCLGGDRRASSGPLSVCRCCGGGGGAPLCSSAPAVLWRLGAGSPTKEPSPRWSLQDFDPSGWSFCRCSGAGAFSFPLPLGAGPLGPGTLGPSTACWWRTGVEPGIWSPRLGSPPSCRTARPPSSRVGIDARTDDRSAWSSHRAFTPLGRTRDSGTNASPVIAWIAASSSTLVKSPPGPRVILQQSFSPVYT
jgi:hypothetical protein